MPWSLSGLVAEAERVSGTAFADICQSLRSEIVTLERIGATGVSARLATLHTQIVNEAVAAGLPAAVVQPVVTAAQSTVTTVIDAAMQQVATAIEAAIPTPAPVVPTTDPTTGGGS